MKKAGYLGFTLFTFMFMFGSTKALYYTPSAPMVINDASAENKVTFQGAMGTVTCESNNSTVFTISNTGVINPIADGIGKATCVDSLDADGSTEVFILVNINGTYSADLETMATNLGTTYNAKISNKFAGLDLNASSNYSYAQEFIQRDIIINSGLDVSLSEFNTNWTSMSFKLVKYIDSGKTSYYDPFSVKRNSLISLTINFKPYVEADAAKVAIAKTKVKDVYYSYLNDTYSDMFDTVNPNFQRIMMESSSLQEDVGAGIIYEMDARRGDSSPESPSFGGYLTLGINGTYYDYIEPIDFVRVLKIPKVNGNDKTAAIQKYFEDNLIDDDEEVSITANEGPDGTSYVATISEKSGALGFISKLLFPKAYADNNRVVGFTLVESNEITAEQNPQTHDNLIGFILLGSVSIVGILGSVLYFNKKKKFN